METHSSVLTWRVPWTEEPGELQSMGLQRVGHDWAHSQIVDLQYCVRSRWTAKWFSYIYIHMYLFFSDSCPLCYKILSIIPCAIQQVLADYLFYISCCCLVTPSCQTFCDPMDCSQPGFSVHGIFQAGILEWIAIPVSRGSSLPRDWTQVSCFASLIAQLVKNLPAMQKTPVRFMGREDSLEKG